MHWIGIIIVFSSYFHRTIKLSMNIWENKVKHQSLNQYCTAIAMDNFGSIINTDKCVTFSGAPYTQLVLSWSWLPACSYLWVSSLSSSPVLAALVIKPRLHLRQLWWVLQLAMLIYSRYRVLSSWAWFVIWAQYWALLALLWRLKHAPGSRCTIFCIFLKIRAQLKLKRCIYALVCLAHEKGLIGHTNLSRGLGCCNSRKEPWWLKLTDYHWGTDPTLPSSCCDG